ncbi:MAG: DUF502 domain-containing protein [Armatimonadota bacterium]|nr:DUF502 domain-containing protein [Armatimonadota bacterium]
MMQTHLRGYFLKGLLVVLPAAVTFAVLRWLLAALDAVLQPFSRALLGSRFPPVVVAIIGVGLIVAAGALASNVIGRRLLAAFDAVMLRVPLTRMIYSTTRQLAEMFLTGERTTFQRVVLLEWPRRGLYALGFATRERVDASGHRVLHAFVGSTPNPTTGFLVTVPASDTRALELTVEDGFTIVLSGGIAGALDKVAQGIAAFREDGGAGASRNDAAVPSTSTSETQDGRRDHGP